jgi:putative ABC transport system permease protein
MQTLDDLLLSFLDDPRNVVAAGALAFVLVVCTVHYVYVRLVLKSLLRNPLRTGLTSMAIMVLVFVVTLIWSMLALLDAATREKSRDLKALVTERWQLPSQMPFSYEASLKDGAAGGPGDVRPQDYMSWQFYGATTDERRTRESLAFFFAIEPRKALAMMDGLDTLTGREREELEEMVRMMEQDKRRIVLGRDRIKALNKRVGDRISLYSINYLGIDFDECEIIGVLPEGSWNLVGIMNRDRLNNALDAYKQRTGKPHPMDGKSLNIVWLKVPDMAAYNRVAQQITESPLYTNPAVKCETASSGVAAFLDAYRDLLWGLRWLLVPAILAIMALVIATAISISVRERRTEIAVLKVLGYTPWQVLGLVLSEAVFIGALSGFLSVAATFLFINGVLGGVKFPIAFFPAFRIPVAQLWLGPLVGGLTALTGSIVPAWSARSVKVSEVFARIA